MEKVKSFSVGKATFGDGRLTVIAGPCVIESPDHAMMMARECLQRAQAAGLDFVFKSSFDKANRSSIHSFRGLGMEAGLEVLQRVKEEMGVPVLTDVHDVSQVERVAEVVDVLQIPAFLCRQTDLIVAAVKSGRAVNIKKGQFLAPQDAGNIVDKVREAGGEKLLLTERGASFGYNNLVVDMRSLPIMRELWRTGCFRCDAFAATARRAWPCNRRPIRIHRISRARRSRFRIGCGFHGSSRLPGEGAVRWSECAAAGSPRAVALHVARHSRAGS